MKFNFYIRNQGEEKGQIEAASFEFRGNPYCTGDIRDFNTDGRQSIHFRENSDTTDFQELMNRTTERIGNEEGFNTKIAVEIPDDQIEIDHQPFMILGIYFDKEFIPTLETNS